MNDRDPVNVILVAGIIFEVGLLILGVILSIAVVTSGVP